ncbi:DUF6279 family lipoprotein [Ideonella sp. DXS22W]|uniref:DUF6279 family lipoprotein n=1 Tax=Pseudaquabacterium inlustre TaxID=2984192 RepID=A0ABU9CRZ3_9BURK
MRMRVLLPWKPRIIGRLRGALLTVCVLGLTACSAVRLGYDQGPTLAWWWLDRQLDFSSAQKPRVQAALDDWFAWHRATQLPAYADELAQLQRLKTERLAPAQVCTLFAGWQQRLRTAATQALPAAAEIVRTLTPAQLEHLERHQAEVLDDAARQFLKPGSTEAERRQALIDRETERFESLYGTLQDAQRRRLAEALVASPFDAERWLAERRARSADLLRALRQWQAERADAATVQAGLQRLADELLASPRPAYREQQRRVTEANCAIVAELHNSATPAQRQRAAERLKRWEEDARALAAAPRGRVPQ